MLVEQHAVVVYRLAAAIVGSRDAADVAQETFVSAWRKLPQLRDADRFAAWLRRICANRSRNWLRSQRRRPEATLRLDDEEPTDSLATSTHDFRGAIEARAVLEPAFESLSPDQRTLLALHYSLGLSIPETADALAIRVGTAKSRLNGALAVLRRALADPLTDVDTEDIGTEATS